MTPLDWLFWLGAVGAFVFLGWFVKLTNTVRHDIEDAINEADEAEQAELKRKVVKALYPPRFFRD